MKRADEPQRSLPIARHRKAHRSRECPSGVGTVKSRATRRHECDRYEHVVLCMNFLNYSCCEFGERWLFEGVLVDFERDDAALNCERHSTRCARGRVRRPCANGDLAEDIGRCNSINTIEFQPLLP